MINNYTYSADSYFYGINSMTIDSATANNSSGSMTIVDIDTSEVLYYFTSGTHTSISVDGAAHPNVMFGKSKSGAAFSCVLTGLRIS